MTSDVPAGEALKIWDCKIGEVERAKLPAGSDGPMRRAVEQAYFNLTGQWPHFIFSGWGAQLDESERAVVENRLPHPEGSAQSTPTTAPTIDGVTPALHEGGRFRKWSTVNLAAQCISQAREQLDPEFSQFMIALAERLTAPEPTRAGDDREVGLLAALEASLAKRSQPTMDPPYTAAFNAALDMVARDTRATRAALQGTAS